MFYDIIYIFRVLIFNFKINLLLIKWSWYFIFKLNYIRQQILSANRLIFKNIFYEM